MITGPATKITNPGAARIVLGLKEDTMMRKIALLLLLAMVFGINCFGADGNGGRKVLVVYYSHTGNTKQMAGIIHGLSGGDLVELKSVDPYPPAYSEVLEQARREINSGYKPPLAAITEDINAYDVIFVGYPIWFGTTPPPIASFLSRYDLSGKTIVPFCTSGSSSGDASFRNVQTLCPRAAVLEGLQIRGTSVGGAETVITGWLRRIGIVI
jgi:flavodoxin